MDKLTMDHAVQLVAAAMMARPDGNEKEIAALASKGMRAARLVHLDEVVPMGNPVKVIRIDENTDVVVGDRAVHIWPGVAKFADYLYKQRPRLVTLQEIKARVMNDVNCSDHAVYTLKGDFVRALPKDYQDAVETKSGRSGGYRWNMGYELEFSPVEQEAEA